MLRLRYGFGVQLAQQKIQAGQFSYSDVLRIHALEHCRAYGFGIGEVFVSQQFKAQVEATPRYAGNGHINAISRGAAHDPGNDQARFSMTAPSCISSTMLEKSWTSSLTALMALALGAGGKSFNSAERCLNFKIRAEAWATCMAKCRSFSASRSTAS